MPGREEGLGRCYPLRRAMLVTQLHARGVWDGAAIVHTNHCMLGKGVTAIEVRRAEDTLAMHVQTQFFEGFPPHRLPEALPLLKPPGDTLPLSGSHVLGGRTLQQKVLTIRVAPDQRTDH